MLTNADVNKIDDKFKAYKDFEVSDKQKHIVFTCSSRSSLNFCYVHHKELQVSMRLCAQMQIFIFR